VNRYACRTCDYEDESYEAVLKHIESSHGKKDSDPVHSPAHYTAGGIETIDFIRAKLSREEFVGYCRGNVLKYVTRAPHKGGVEDYRKAAVYLQWAIEAEEGEKS